MPLSQQKIDWLIKVDNERQEHRGTLFYFKVFRWALLVAMLALVARFMLTDSWVNIAAVIVLFIGLNGLLYFTARYQRTGFDMLAIEIAIVKDDPNLISLVKEDFTSHKDLDKILNIYNNPEQKRPEQQTPEQQNPEQRTPEQHETETHEPEQPK